jgi:nucleotide-binding universal stress UspA family protein
MSNPAWRTSSVAKPSNLSREHLGRRPALTDRMLVATDGTVEAGAAMRLAAVLAVRAGATPEVLSVLAPLPVPVPPLAAGFAMVPTDALDDARRSARAAEIHDQIIAASGEAQSAWPTRVAFGDASRVITEVAAARTASAIILGLRPHGTLDRVFRDETALQVMRRATTPVLAVVPRLTGLPRRVIAAIDFSRGSLRAARAALEVMPEDGTLYLVHVRPQIGVLVDRCEGMEVIYAHGVGGAFARFRRELSAPPSVKLETVFLQGETTPELRSLVERAEADLIAIGSHRHSLMDRMILGSVTTALAHDARVSMLVSPPENR